MKVESKQWHFSLWPWTLPLHGLITFGNRGWTFHLFHWRPSTWIAWGHEHSWYDGPWDSWWLGPFCSFHTTPDWCIDWKAVRAREAAEAAEQNHGGDA